MSATVTPWAFLDEYRGKDFAGEWPTLPEMYRISAKRYPERPCFTVYEPDRISLSYAEALERILAVAGKLIELGVKKGDKVAVTGKNSPEWAVAYMGILFADATVVPIDYQLKNEEIDNRYKETSVGRLSDQVQMKILNADERGVGEIVVKGPMVMKGYYKMPAETKEVFTEDGWFKTGDLGYLDSENYLYLTGRAKNLIVTEGGKNVYPEEIENEFQLYEEIEQILVRGFVSDKKMKIEGIEALVFPNAEAFKNGQDVQARIGEIIAEVNQRLLPYQRIEKTTILDEAMEMTTTKKIKRTAV